MMAEKIESRMGKVSIIIPVYNVEAYIKQCLESVAAQTYKDIEVYIVDDCGNDASMDIVEKFISDYHGPINFNVLKHEYNRGPSAARNSGINASYGEYIYFMDSDDMITPDCIELLLCSICQRDDIQMAIGDIEVLNVKEEWKLLKMQPGIYDKELWSYFYQLMYYVYACNKLIRRSFIEGNNLFFEEGLIHEDCLWSFQAACHLSCFSVVRNKTYKYIKRTCSLSNTGWLMQNYNYCIVCKLQMKYAHQYFRMWRKKSVYDYIDKIRVELMEEALSEKNNEAIDWNYKMIRDGGGWNTFWLICRGFSLGSILRSLHKYLPYDTGKKFYVSVVRKFGY